MPTSVSRSTTDNYRRVATAAGKAGSATGTYRSAPDLSQETSGVLLHGCCVGVADRGGLLPVRCRGMMLLRRLSAERPCGASGRGGPALRRPGGAGCATCFGCKMSWPAVGVRLMHSAAVHGLRFVLLSPVSGPAGRSGPGVLRPGQRLIAGHWSATLKIGYICTLLHR